MSVRHPRRNAALIAATLAVAASAHAADTWIPTAGGSYNWNTPGDWSPAVPNSASVEAIIAGNFTSQQYISANNETVGTLVIGNESAGIYQPTINDANSTPFTIGSATTTGDLFINSDVPDQVGATINYLNVPGNLLIESYSQFVSPNSNPATDVVGINGISNFSNLEINHAQLNLYSAQQLTTTGTITLDGGDALLNLVEADEMPNVNIRMNDSSDGLNLDAGQVVNSIGGNGFIDLTGAYLDVQSTSTFAGSLVSQSAGELSIETGTLTFTSTALNYLFFGDILVNSGATAAFSSAAVLGYGSTILAGGTLEAKASYTSYNQISFYGNSNIAVDTGTTLTQLGGIIGPGALTDNETGTLALGGNNSYAGGTTINGSVSVSSDANLGNPSGGITFGYWFVKHGNTNFAVPGTLIGSASFSSARYIATGPYGAQLNPAAGTTMTLTGQISGSGAVNVNGPGAVSFATDFGNNDYNWRSNSYTGGTIINDGVLQIIDDSQLGDPSGTLSFFGGTLEIAGSLSQSSRSVTLDGPATIQVDAGTNYELAGTVSGSGGALTKTGAGTLQLLGNNTHSVGTIISAGTLAVAQTMGGANPLGSGPVTLNGGTLNLQGGAVAATGLQPVSSTGFNQDVVVERSASNYQAAVTSAFDATNNSTGFAFYENGYQPGTTGATGLPQNRVITSTMGNRTTFNLQPYNASNVLLLSTTNDYGYLQLAQPGIFNSISVLASASDGNASTIMEVDFADGAFVDYPETVDDWFTSTTGAYSPNGRVSLSDGTFQNLNSGFPLFYEIDLPIPAIDQADPIVDVAFEDISGGNLGVFALGGNANAFSPTQTYSNNVNVNADSTINVANSTNAVMSGLTIGSNTLYTTGDPGASLTFTNSIVSGNANFDVAPNTFLNLLYTTGTGSITKSNAGQLLLDFPSFSGPITVNGGTLQVNGNLTQNAVTIASAALLRLGGNEGLQTLSSLSIATGGTFDISNNHLLLTYGSGPDPIASIAAWIAAGYAGGTWNGTGIISTAAQFNPNYGIGYADSADPGNPAGLPSGTIEIKYTLLGDADLNGIVNGIDFGILAANFNKGVTGWDKGDFDYNNVVNGVDFGDLAANFNKGANFADTQALFAFAEARGLMADVPEPAIFPILSISGTALLASRKRRASTQSRL